MDAFFLLVVMSVSGSFSFHEFRSEAECRAALAVVEKMEFAKAMNKKLDVQGGFGTAECARIPRSAAAKP
jgi:hypothetical protein